MPFDPEKVGQIEADGWRAYYDHNWLKMLGLLIQACQEQFHMPFPAAVLAAYYIVRASAGWVAIDHDEAKILALHEKFYRMARRYSGLTFDPLKAAQLEERYWEVHRRLSGLPDKTEFIQTMIDLHSTVFSITPDQARESAELRVQANNTVDLITSQTSTDPESDWRKIEDLLKQCYRSVQRAMKA